MTILPAFEVILPASLKEALSVLHSYASRTKVIAGGTDLIPGMKQRLFEPEFVLDIKPLTELRGIRSQSDGSLQIGALTTITEIATDPVVLKDFPVLHQAASTVAGPNLRNVGTIGGNICLDTRCYWYNQSYFWRKACGFCIKKDGTMCHVAPGSKQCWAVYSGDTAAALITLQAKLHLASVRGERIVPVEEFFVNDGQRKNILESDEILTQITIPVSTRGYQGAYEKFRIRGSVDYPLAGVAVAIKKSNGTLEDLRLALTAVNPKPVSLPSPMFVFDKEGIEGLKKLAMKTAKPLKTSASTMDYRRYMVGVMIKRSLEKLGVQ